MLAPVLTVKPSKLMSRRVYRMLVRLFINGWVPMARSRTVGIEFRAHATK